MERMALEARLRPVGASKGELNIMRSSDLVPAVVYGRGKETKHLTLEGRPLRHALSSGSNAIIELSVSGEESGALEKETVMFKDVQKEILFSDRLVHVDFIRISLTEKRLVNIPLQVVGDAPGVKEGGVLQILLREVEVYCLPTAIPESLEVDISSLNIGETLTGADLQLPEAVELQSDPTEAIVIIAAPAQAEAAKGAEEGEAGDTAAEAAGESEESEESAE